MADNSKIKTPTFEDLLAENRYQNMASNGSDNVTFSNSASRIVYSNSAQAPNGDSTPTVMKNNSTSHVSAPYVSVMTQNPSRHPRNQFSLNQEKSKFSGSIPIIIGAIVGLGLGILLSQVNPSKTVADWIALPGELFIRGLKLLVVPMIFSSLTVATTDIMVVGKAYSIGWRVAALNVFTSILGSIQGVLFAIIFRPFFTTNVVSEFKSYEIDISLQCGNGLFLSLNEDGVLACQAANDISNSSHFLVNDLSNVLQKEDEFEKVSFSQQIIAILKQMAPENLTQAFADGALLSVVMFSLPFGVAVARSHRGSPQTNELLNIIRQVNNTFLLLIRWIIDMSPFAVISLIAGSMAQNDDQLSLVQKVGSFLLCVTSGLSFHAIITLPVIFFIFTRQNPFAYLKQMIPAQVFALGCGSSIASIPVTMRCVEITREVTRNLIRFVIPIGATVNMDGTAIYYPIAIIFLAEVEGVGDKIGLVQLLLLVIVSTIASIGSAPVPNSGLVVVLTVWQTIMNEEVPDSFSFIVAIDWLLDRLVTAVNITGDAVIVRIIADQVDERYESE